MAGEKQARYKQLHFYIKITLLVWGLALVTFFVFPQASQHLIADFFEQKKSQQSIQKNECIPLVDYPSSLNDEVRDHWQYSFRNGIKRTLKDTRGIQALFDQQKIVLIEPCTYYTIDRLTHSYPFAVVKVRSFLNELGKRFQQRLANTKLADAKFQLTSLLRTERSLKRLRRINRNATKNSTHLHGTTIDIAYDVFFDAQLHPHDSTVSNYLKEQLAEILIELRKEQQCWVKYERFQPCFHVVVR